MKNILFLLLAFTLLTPFIVLAQNDSTKPRTQLEASAVKIGTIIKKNYDEIYTYKAKAFSLTGGNSNLTCKVLTIKDLASQITVKGLYLYTQSYGTYGRGYTGYIDANEIPGLIKFLEFLNANKDNTEPDGTEYVYSSNDVQFAAFNSKNKKEEYWNYVVKVDRFYDSSNVYLDITDIAELIQKLKDNQSKFE